LGGNLWSMNTLTRSSTDRKLGGVAAGLADYFNADPILFRVGFVAATLATGGAAAIAYAGLYLFTPAETDVALAPA
jgi:phage shock protein PspC (stress-responsive transcriptional regulator)